MNKSELRSVIAEENQKLLLKIEDLIMSAITPIIQDLQTKVAALKQANADKDTKLADLQTQLNTAQQNAVDPADVQLLNDIISTL